MRIIARLWVNLLLKIEIKCLIRTMPSKLPNELLDHLCRLSSLPRTEVTHLVTEVLAYFNESLDDFVRRRHRELQGQGLPNNKIYSLISNELEYRRFPSMALTERKVRRIIYG